MNESDQKPDATEVPGDPAIASSAEISSAARRRQVLRGLSSGAVLAAAGAPLPALATGGRKYCFHKSTPHKKVKASISGMQSVITSNMTSDWTESPGKKCTFYKNTANWPSDSSGKFCRGKNNAKYRENSKFKDVFGCAGGGHNDLTIKNLLDSDIAPHCHWIAACLNASKLGSNFSYNAAEIVNLFHDPQKNLFALTFFRDYQENYSY